jgi:hypothetical protein
MPTVTEKFEARDNNGTLVREYVSNGKVLTEAEGRAWLKTFLPEILREMAVNADRRVARQLARGGPALVLDEVGRTKSSYAKSVYLRELFKQATLDQPMLARSLQQARRDIHSDYDLAEALIAASEHQPIDRALNDFVAAAGTVKSDYDERRVLSKAITRPSLTPQVASAIFKAATPAPDGSGIQSGYDLAELLREAPPAVVDQASSGWAAAVSTITSAYDRSRAIEAMFQPGLSPATVQGALAAAAGISSDYDLATLLVTAADKGALTDSTANAYFEATGHVHGSYDRGRVLHQVAKAPIGDAALAQAISLAASMTSDYDRAEALIALSAAKGIGPASRKALTESAGAMHGDYDRGRVMSALERAGIR